MKNEKQETAKSIITLMSIALEHVYIELPRNENKKRNLLMLF